jgi:hypothetical protein
MRPPRHRGRVTAFVVAAAMLVWQAAHAASDGHGPAPVDAGREVVITGEVVESGCYVMAGRRGEEHRQCAIACARAAQPLAILEDKTGIVHLAIYDRAAAAPNDSLLEHVADRVEIRGTAIERGGITAILVKRVRSLSPDRAAP